MEISDGKLLYICLAVRIFNRRESPFTHLIYSSEKREEVKTVQTKFSQLLQNLLLCHSQNSISRTILFTVPISLSQRTTVKE